MPKQVTSLRSVAVALIVAASLWLPTLSVVHADQQAEKTHAATMSPKKHAARMHHRKQKEAEIAPRFSAAAPNSPGCTWPYRNMFPPCMSTWPGGDPNYHGPQPGVTFDQPWSPNDK